MIFIFFIAASLATACFDVDIQTFRQIDPARFKEINYPALTDREGKDLTLPVPPPEHPRLFFRKSDIETIFLFVTQGLLPFVIFIRNCK